MLRSFFNGISGLKVHQTRIDVISNNISNVNTTGYKAARATFKDVVALTLKGARAPYAGRGGTNPSQVGLGVDLATIDNIMTQGAINTTNRSSDLAIQGNGFFVVSDGQRNWFTRDGAFDLDLNGRLIQLSSGLKVQGWSLIPTQKIRFDGSITPSASVQTALRVFDSQGNEHVLTAVVQCTSASTATVKIYEGTTPNANSTPIFTQDLGFANNSVQSGQTGVLNWNGMSINLDFTSLELASLNASITADAVVEADTNKVGDIVIPRNLTIPPSPTGNVQFQGNLNAMASESSNVTFTVSNIIDSLGVTHSMLINAVKRSNPNEWNVTVSVEGLTQSYVLQFDTNGRISSVTDPNNPNTPIGTMPTITFDPGNGAAPRPITLNFSALTQYAADSKVVGLVDGNTNGKILNWFVTSEGKVMGEFDNGQIKQLAQIALASFQNPSGLSRDGNNLWANTANSGFRGFLEATDIGSNIISGALEMSNVDIAEEFTNLIITQRGFQANTRVITTSDEVTQDIINLKR